MFKSFKELKEEKAKKQEGKVVELPDEKEVLEVSTEPVDTKIEKEDKTSFEEFKVLYKGQIDDKCLEDYGTIEDKKLWEDTAKELFMASEDYIPDEDDKAEKIEESKEIIEEERYQVREYEGSGAKFGVYDIKEKKFVQKGSKYVMEAACKDLNEKGKVTESSIIKYTLKEMMNKKQESVEEGASIFELKFDCSNEDTFGIGYELEKSISDILYKVADKVKSGMLDSSILDINGNKIGSYGIGYEGVQSGLSESKKVEESVREDLIQLRKDNKGLYDYVANNYYNMSTEELKEIALNAIYVADNDFKIIDEYLERMDESVDADIEKAKEDSIKKSLYCETEDINDIVEQEVTVTDGDKDINSVMVVYVSNQTFMKYYNLQKPLTIEELKSIKLKIKNHEMYVTDIKDKLNATEVDSKKELIPNTYIMKIKENDIEDLEEEKHDSCIMCGSDNLDGCFVLKSKNICKECGKKYSLEEIENKLESKNIKTESQVSDYTFKELNKVVNDKGNDFKIQIAGSEDKTNWLNIDKEDLQAIYQALQNKNAK